MSMLLVSSTLWHNMYSVASIILFSLVSKTSTYERVVFLSWQKIFNV